MSIARWNPKEAAGKALARRTEIAYEACKLDEEANVFKVRYLYGKLVPRCGGLGRGPWWHAGASHMHAAFPKSYFDRCELSSLLDQRLRFQRTSWTAVYGTVRTVVWEDGGRDSASYPIEDLDSQRVFLPHLTLSPSLTRDLVFERTEFAGQEFTHVA